MILALFIPILIASIVLHEVAHGAREIHGLEEAAQIIRRMLTEERTTFSGIHYQVDDASCLPRPVQERLPIWIGDKTVSSCRAVL